MKTKATLLNQGLWCPSDETPELAMVAQQQQHNKKNQVSGNLKTSSNQNTKNVDKEKKHLCLHKNNANWEIPNNGMKKHSTSVLPPQTFTLAHSQGQGL